MKRILLTIVISAFCLLLSPLPLHAFDPTGFPSNPTCDLCGGCRDANDQTLWPQDWNKCRACLYTSSETPPNPESLTARPVEGKMWTPIGCIGTETGQAGGLVGTILKFVVSIAGGLAFFGFLAGGFMILTAQGDPLRITSGKNTVIGSIGALILILFSVFLLKFIGISVLGLPGMQ